MDGSTHLPPISPVRQTSASVRTLFTTAHRYDAGLAGFDGPVEPGVDGGFSVTFDGRGSVPAVEVILSDGFVYGYEAVRELGMAITKAELLCAAMRAAA